jgi:hypothetical protein
MLKIRIYNLSLLSWQLNSDPLQTFISLDTWLSIPWPGKPCWVLEYSALPCNFCSGDPPDDSALPVPWPYPLPDGWSVEWDSSPANADSSEWCNARASMTSIMTTCTILYFEFRYLTWNLCLFCNNFPVGKAISLLNTHVIYLPVMWNVMAFVSLDSPSCGVPCWSCIWWFIGTLPDRPRNYTVWSTSEPAKVDSHTWAGVIQVGSATLTATTTHCNLNQIHQHRRGIISFHNVAHNPVRYPYSDCRMVTIHFLYRASDRNSLDFYRSY